MSYFFVIFYLLLLESFRTRWLLSLGLILLVSLMGILFLGEISLTETHLIQSVLTAAFLRYCALFFLATFVMVSQARQISDHQLELFLSLPVSRYVYLLSKLLSFCALGSLLAFIVSCPLIFLNFKIAWRWGISLALELNIVAALSLFFILRFHELTISLLATIGFYGLSRVMNDFLLMLHDPLYQHSFLQPIFSFSLEVLSFLFPRLDLFTQSAWFASKAVPHLFPLWIQSSIYLLFLYSLTYFDFIRKKL